MPEKLPSRESSNAGGFAATHWTVVLAAVGGRDSSYAAEAMAELCRTYWYPLYAFLRRRGHDTHEAEDLTQAFFARLISRDSLANVDRKKGKFRSYLLGALQHFLSDEHDRASAQKRGGGQKVISLDALDAESRYRLEPAQDLTPERMFEKQWALTVLDHVLVRLKTEMTADGKEALFEALKTTLVGGGETDSYAAIAAQLGSTEGAIKTAAHRLRRRYRDLLRDEITQIVATPD